MKARNCKAIRPDKKDVLRLLIAGVLLMVGIFVFNQRLDDNDSLSLMQRQPLADAGSVKTGWIGSSFGANASPFAMMDCSSSAGNSGSSTQCHSVQDESLDFNDLSPLALMRNGLAEINTNNVAPIYAINLAINDCVLSDNSVLSSRVKNCDVAVMRGIIADVEAALISIQNTETGRDAMLAWLSNLASLERKAQNQDSSLFNSISPSMGTEAEKKQFRLRLRVFLEKQDPQDTYIQALLDHLNEEDKLVTESGSYAQSKI